MGLEPNCYQLENETCYLAKVSKFYVEKGCFCCQAWNCHLQHVNVYFTDQNIYNAKGGPHRTEDIEMQK